MPREPQNLTPSAYQCARATFAMLSAANLRPVAEVRDTRGITDLATLISPSRLAVIRCVEVPTADDHLALATMVAEGDFVWAALVCGDNPELGRLGGAEVFHVSELPRLVGRLKTLQGALVE
jgi:hypothetical protein